MFDRAVAEGIRMNMKLRRIRDMREMALIRDERGLRPYKLVLVPGHGLRVGLRRSGPVE